MLSKKVLKIAQRLDPETIIRMGGPEKAAIVIIAAGRVYSTLKRPRIKYRTMRMRSLRQLQQRLVVKFGIWNLAMVKEYEDSSEVRYK